MEKLTKKGKKNETNLIPVEKLTVFKGIFASLEVRILKDDECNKNVISSDFARKQRNKSFIIECDIEVSHSSKGTV